MLLVGAQYSLESVRTPSSFSHRLLSLATAIQHVPGYADSELASCRARGSHREGGHPPRFLMFVHSAPGAVPRELFSLRAVWPCGAACCATRRRTALRLSL